MIYSHDTAAVLGAAMSLVSHVETSGPLLQEMVEHYAGFDGLMRSAMHAAEQFEHWSLEKVDFSRLDHAWPYLLRECFGEACASYAGLKGLEDFTAADCLRVAMKMNLPLRCSS